MALTSDEEAAVRALLEAIRKLPDAPSFARTVPDGPVSRALGGIEQHLRAIATIFRKVR